MLYDLHLSNIITSLTPSDVYKLYFPKIDNTEQVSSISHIYKNKDLPRVSNITSITNLTAPVPPPGFSTRLKFNPSVQLKPLEVYICIIELMSILLTLSWTSTIPLAMEMSGARVSTMIILNPFPPLGASRLRVQWAVLALYHSGVEIAQSSQFYELDAAIYLDDLEVGWLDIRPKSARGSDSHLLALSSDCANGTIMVTADSGKIVDPDESGFAVTFSFDGVRVKAQDIFTTVLDSLAIAAEHNDANTNAYIPAARSASGDTVLSTWTVGKGESADMTWARLKRALIMLSKLLMKPQQGHKPRFEGLSFGFVYEEREIGAGRMLRFDQDSESSGGTATEK